MARQGLVQQVPAQHVLLSREAAAMWLGGSEPLLGGSRPIDVLAAEGASRVIRAIDGIEQGAFA